MRAGGADVVMEGVGRPRTALNREYPTGRAVSGAAISTRGVPSGTMPGVRIYGCGVDGGDVFDLFVDQVEAEFALLDVVTDEPGLAADLAVVEIEASTVRVAARAGGLGLGWLS